ncbi:MAG: stage II sporulation protein D [Oscillospiraceae bacterium]|nr:stage II sporulation protein D [Oscillospiraceae bacterium]
MKKKLMLYGFLCLLMTLMPLIPARMFSAEQPVSDENPEEITETASESPSEPEVYHVLDTDSGEILEVPVREYLIGAVGAEMPVTFEPEALKAQAVAAHTYAERQKELADRRPELKGADFSDDASQYQAFYTKEELQKLYADKFQQNYQKLEEAVDSVLHEILLYQDEPIIAAFHAMSGGKTESAKNVWGSEIAYLQSVDSSADKTAPQFEQTVSYTAEQVRDMLSASREGLFLGTDTAHWFGEAECSEAGTVLQIPVGTSIFTGQELRTIFGLRSAVFQVRYEDKNFIFTTYGYGHDVGMSQYGANVMAQNGADYREILAYYYPETELKTVS